MNTLNPSVSRFEIGELAFDGFDRHQASQMERAFREHLSVRLDSILSTESDFQIDILGDMSLTLPDAAFQTPDRFGRELANAIYSRLVA